MNRQRKNNDRQRDAEKQVTYKSVQAAVYD